MRRYRAIGIRDRRLRRTRRRPTQPKFVSLRTSVVVATVLPATTGALDLDRHPAPVATLDDGLDVAHPGAEAAEAVDPLEAGVAGDLDALDTALGVVEPERAVLAVDGEDGALELGGRGRGRGGRHGGGEDDGDGDACDLHGRKPARRRSKRSPTAGEEPAKGGAMRIGVLGTGMVGRAISGKLAELGHDVRVGSRTEGDGAVRFADAAAHGELVFNCTNGAGSLDALAAAGEDNL